MPKLFYLLRVEHLLWENWSKNHTGRTFVRLFFINFAHVLILCKNV